MRPKKNELHELPNTEMAKSGTIRLTVPLVRKRLVYSIHCSKYLAHGSHILKEHNFLGGGGGSLLWLELDDHPFFRSIQSVLLFILFFK